MTRCVLSLSVSVCLSLSLSLTFTHSRLQVFGTASFDDGLGGFAEYCVAAENTVAVKPQKVSFVEAASFPVASLTSLQALRKAKFEVASHV